MSNVSSLASRSGVPLPLALDGITLEWLTRALKRDYPQAPQARVEAFDVVDLIHGLSAKVRLEWRLNEAGRAAGLPPRVFSKPDSNYTVGSCSLSTRGCACPPRPLSRDHASHAPALFAVFDKCTGNFLSSSRFLVDSDSDELRTCAVDDGELRIE